MSIASPFSTAFSTARVPEMLGGIMLAAGMVLSLLVAPWSGVALAGGVGAAVVVVALLSVARSSRTAHGVAVGAVALALLALLIGGLQALRVAAADMANTFIDAWNAQVDGYVLHFAVSSVPEFATILFALFVGIAVGLVVHAVCVRHSRMVVVFVAVLFLVLDLFFQTISIAAFVCVVLGGLFLGGCYSLHTEASLRDMPVFAITIVVVVGVTLGTCVGYQGNDALHNAKEDALAALDEAWFGSDSLPQGNLTRAHTMNALSGDESTDRLNVTFSDGYVPRDAEPLYLRGFVGTTYTGTSFERLKPADYEGDWTGLFTWLNARDFKTLSQYADYRALDDAEAGKASSMVPVEVQTQGAYRRYAYAPTSATEAGSGELLDLYRSAQGWGSHIATFSTIANDETAETIVPGNWVYEQAAALEGSAAGGSADNATAAAGGSVSDTAGTVGVSGAAADQGEQAQNEQDFLRGELAYRSFVYDRYLDVPAEIADDIDQYFFADEASGTHDAVGEGSGTKADGDKAGTDTEIDEATLYSTLTRIRTMLDVGCDYQEQGVPFKPSASVEGSVSSGDAGTTSGVSGTAGSFGSGSSGTGAAEGAAGVSSDYVLWFLHDAREGNSAAFASAAVLAFRQAGVPARYAEGYVLSEDIIKSMRALDTNTCTLSEHNAHAWVEVYVDGAGWMPVEVTPGFYDRVYSSDETVEIAREVAGVGRDDTNTGSTGDDAPDWTDQLPEELRPFAWLGLILLIVLVALLMVGMFEAQRLVRLHIYNVRLRTAQAQGTASVVLFGRMKRLIKDASVPFDDMAPQACAAALVQAREEVHPAEYQRVLALMERERYGQMPFEDFEMAIIVSLLEKLEAGNWQRASLLRRLRYRYVGLYLIPLRHLR